MQVDTLGFLSVQANAKCDMLHPISSAIFVKFLTFSILALPSEVSRALMLSVISTLLVEYRESSGMPLLYLPVSNPESSGDQMVLRRFSTSYTGWGVKRRSNRPDLRSVSFVFEQRFVFHFESISVKHRVMRLFTSWTDHVESTGDFVSLLNLELVPLGSACHVTSTWDSRFAGPVNDGGLTPVERLALWCHCQHALDKKSVKTTTYGQSHG